MLLGVHDLDSGKFAQAIGASATSVSYWLNGHREPSADNLVHLAGWFYVDAAALLRESPDQFVKRVGDPERFAQVERFLAQFPPGGTAEALPEPTPITAKKKR